MTDASASSTLSATPSDPRRDLAQLLIPAIPWSQGSGFGDARPLINEALALGVGGFLLLGGEQDVVRALAKELQLKSKHPLLIAADLERGAGQQFSGATGLPPVAAIAAVGDIESLKRAARLTAREARTMGVNWNLSPVCDLDLFDDNPLLGTRALSRDPRKAGQLATAWVEACQAEGVLACAKHFPGSGRALSDAHVELPVIEASAEIIKDQDLAPFRAVISAGVASIMTAHAAYPALDPSRVPATLSRELLQWLLRQQLKYDNLIVADAMDMAGVHEDRTGAESAVQALRAGCDVLLQPGDLNETLDALVAALASGALDPDRVRQSVRRRLKWAQWASPPNDWRRPSGADTAWGALLADRVINVQNGPLPPIGGITEVIIIDDDEDIDGIRPERTFLLDALRVGGTDARAVETPTTASGGPLVVALFADYLPFKGRTKLKQDSVDRITRAKRQAADLQRETILLGLGDPRFANQINQGVPTVVAWSGDRVMQQAAARAIQKTRKM
ncbi:MAG: glycoside hydrolase family 3 N-terminal domain-containing protein [Gemmatimonadaceae bacterium]